jgi:hypothetical protein
MLEVKATDSYPVLGPIAPWSSLRVSFEIENWHPLVFMDDNGVIG